ncbi:MAG: hypothetical protein WA461_07745 [Nitrososphaeraceae archaeon]
MDSDNNNRPFWETSDVTEQKGNDNVSFSTKITSENIAKRIEQLEKLQATLRYKAKLDEYHRQVQRGKELIRVRKESRYNMENRPPPIYLGDGTMKVSRWRWLPKELEDDDSY